jgi:hypothetical protein
MGLWSSYLDANFQKEFRRRQRVVKHKYMEALHRKLLWDRHFPMQLRHLEHSGLKSFMCSAWRGQDSRPGGRWVNSDDLDYMKKKDTNKKEGGIEDVEQTALDQLLEKHNKFIRAKAYLFGPGWSSCHSASWVSRPELRPDTIPTDHASTSSKVYGKEGFRKRFQPDENNHYEEHAEYEIDPITNRKVPKKTAQLPVESTPNDIPVNTFKGYRSLFNNVESHEAQEKNAEAPPSQMSPRSPMRVSNPPKNTQAENVDHLEKYEKTKNFKSSRQYDTSETDIDYSDPVQQGLKRYDDQLSKEATTKTTIEKSSARHQDGNDGLEAYDEKVKNKVRQFFASPHEEVQTNDPVQRAIDRYNAFKDVKPPRVTHIDKTDNEDKVLKARREYEYADTRRVAVREAQANKLLASIRNYEEIMAAERSKGWRVSGIIRHEMHPLLKAIQEYEASVKDKKTDPREGAQRDGTDPLLHAIREYKKTVSRTEATSPANQQYIEHAALDPLLNAINNYEALLMNNGIRDGLRNSEDVADKADEGYLREYDAKVNFYRKPHDAEKVVRTSDESSIANKHRTQVAGLPVNKWLKDILEIPSLAKEESAEPKSWAYLPQKIRELFAKEAKSDEKNLGPAIKRTARVPMTAHDASRIRDYLGAADKKARRKALEHDFENTQTAEADAKLSAERLRQRQMILESDINRTQAEYSQAAETAEAGNGSISSKDKSRKMTGSFVRDFPEEFQNVWTASKDSPASLTRKDTPEQQTEASVQNQERIYINGQGGQAAFSGSPDVKRIEPSLNRTVSRFDDCATLDVMHQREGDGLPETTPDVLHQGEGELSALVSPYVTSKQDEPLGLNAHTAKLQSQKEKNARNEQDRDLVREVRSIYEDTYGTIDSKHRQIPATADEKASSKEGVVSINQAVEKQEPTMYKILAYDPTMQSISSAETTSVVPDSSGPLTPAEVLLRLSNPTKFFPHFEPLRTQGYEIVSGSGDVLVFRKVHEAMPTKPEETVTAAAKEDESALEHKKNVMNPIDGMTRGPVAATGDFASPTGFVNHDIPRGSEPPFKSNIDVRREEPVFSGKRNWEYEDEKGRRKRGGVTKRVFIGAGWVAACSYAMGVVLEYFMTGGSDGQGPKGF